LRPGAGLEALVAEPTLRPARTEDIPEVRAVLQASWAAGYESFLDQRVRERVHETWHDAESLARAIESPDRTTIVATQDQTVVGYLAAWRPDPTAEPDLGVVGLLYVDPDHWGIGIGSALWDRGLTALRERGAERVSVRVFAENDLGRSFYEKNGLELTGHIQEDLFGQSVETVEYQTPL
jgi:ribosomal protein S18 acetylase RimI-like enzyme